MIKINETIPEYSENILTSDYTFDNTLPWIFTTGSGVPGNTVSTSTDKRYVGRKSLKIVSAEYDTNAIEVKPQTAGDFDFVVDKNANYSLSMRVYLPSTDEQPVTTMTGKIKIWRNGVLNREIPFSIENQPDGFDTLFSQNKWQTFFIDNLLLSNGFTYNISIYIDPDTSYGVSSATVYFDGFKLEDSSELISDLPTLYSLPIN